MVGLCPTPPSSTRTSDTSTHMVRGDGLTVAGPTFVLGVCVHVVFFPLKGKLDSLCACRCPQAFLVGRFFA